MQGTSMHLQAVLEAIDRASALVQSDLGGFLLLGATILGILLTLALLLTWVGRP